MQYEVHVCSEVFSRAEVYLSCCAMRQKSSRAPSSYTRGGSLPFYKSLSPWLTTVFMGAESCEESLSFSGTFARELSSFRLLLHACYGERARKVFFTRKKTVFHRQSHTAFSGAPARSIIGRGRRTPCSISHDLQHGSHFFSGHVISVPCFLSLEWGLAWRFHNQQKLVTCLCRSCRVKIFFWANPDVYGGKIFQKNLDL